MPYDMSLKKESINLMHMFCIWCLVSIRLAEEKAALLKQCEECVSVKVEETEQLKLQLEEAQQELLLTKKQVCFPALHNKLSDYRVFLFCFF